MLLLYDFVPDYLERRASLREDHLRLIRQTAEIAMAGAHDDDGAFDGAAFVFATDDRDVVRRFAEADPYVQHGLVTRFRIRRWNLVIGG